MFTPRQSGIAEDDHAAPGMPDPAIEPRIDMPHEISLLNEKTETLQEQIGKLVEARQTKG
jgi:hypothetical protein